MPQADSYHPTPRRQNLIGRAKEMYHILLLSDTGPCPSGGMRRTMPVRSSAQWHGSWQGRAQGTFMLDETSWKTPTLVNLWGSRKLDPLAPGTRNAEF